MELVLVDKIVYFIFEELRVLQSYDTGHHCTYANDIWSNWSWST